MDKGQGGLADGSVAESGKAGIAAWAKPIAGRSQEVLGYPVEGVMVLTRLDEGFREEF